MAERTLLRHWQPNKDLVIEFDNALDKRMLRALSEHAEELIGAVSESYPSEFMSFVLKGQGRDNQQIDARIFGNALHKDIQPIITK